MSFSINLSSTRWEVQFVILTQLEYRPVLQRWSREREHGFIWKFLCFVLRYEAGRQS